MDADHDHPVSILLFDLPQLRKGMHAVDSTEGPEIDDCQPPAQVGDVQRPGYVEPVEPFREVGGANRAGVGVNGHPGQWYRRRTHRSTPWATRSAASAAPRPCGTFRTV